jgi:phenylacetate-CoA ligase
MDGLRFRTAAEIYAWTSTAPSRELSGFSKLSPEHQKADLVARLRKQLVHFGKRSDGLQEWGAASSIRDDDEFLAAWRNLPIVTKRDLQERFDPARICHEYGLKGRIKSTGGSTGEPTRFFHDSAMVRATRTLDLYSRQLMGWSTGMPIIAVWGSDRDIGRKPNPWKRLAAECRGDLYVDGYNMTPQVVDSVVRLISRYAPAAIFGFTSMLDYVSRVLIDRGQSLPKGAVRTAWNGGEMLYPEQNERFQAAFGVPILNRYGGRELSTIACQRAPSAHLLVMRPWVMVEVLDSSGRPAAAGECGRIIVTSTVCRGTPFLRYEIGDLGTYESKDLDSAGIASLSTLQGRTAGVIKIRNRQFNNLFWNHLFKESPSVAEFQVVKRRDDTLRISLVGRPGVPSDDIQIRRTLERFLDGIPFELVWLGSIPRTAAGKLIQVISE